MNWSERIREGASETLEFKVGTQLLKEAVQTLCGMANRSGGTVIFGVTDTGAVQGQQISDDTLRSVAQAVQLNTEPRLYPSIRKQEIDGRLCLIAEVEESPLKPHFAYGRPWIRVGSSTQKMSRDEYETLLFQRLNGYGFDYHPAEGADMGDISTDTLLQMIEMANAHRNLNANVLSDKEELLAKLGLLSDRGVPLRAALLLFGKSPGRFFEGHYETKCGHFSHPVHYDHLHSDLLLRGNLFEQFYAARDFLTQRLTQAYTKTPDGSITLPEMPALALREALVNMLVHRDYRTGIKNTVELRADRITLRNPAHLFAPVITVEGLYRPHPSRPGNKKIAHVFYLAGLFENWGGGVSSMLHAMAEHHLPRPQFAFENGIFEVVLHRTATP